MARKTFIWDAADDPDGNVAHIARHNVTTDEAEYVVRNNNNRMQRSRSSSHWITFGLTKENRFILVVWSAIGEDPEVVTVKTAYDAIRPNPKPKGGRR
jgi:uncharacterized DUF497 family protein